MLTLLMCAAPLPAAGFGGAKGKDGIEIKQGKESKVAGTNLKIAFLSVEDSRCPTGVKCFWAGNGRVRLRVSDAKGKHAEFELNTFLKPLEYDFGGYTIKLIKLSPYPTSDGQIEPQDYAATIAVTKSKT